MVTITLAKTEYLELKSRAAAYDRIVRAARREVSLVPKITSRKKIIADIKGVKKYSKEFIADLEQGLKRSDYFTP